MEKTTLKERIKIAEHIYNTTYTINEENSKKIVEKIKEEIRKRNEENIRVPCDCCCCKKYY